MAYHKFQSTLHYLQLQTKTMPIQFSIKNTILIVSDSKKAIYDRYIKRNDSAYQRKKIQICYVLMDSWHADPKMLTRSQLVRNHNVNGKWHFSTKIFCLSKDFPGGIDEVGLVERGAHVLDGGDQEGVGDAATHVSASTRSSRLLSSASFVDSLEPPMMATKGRLGASSTLAKASSSACSRVPAQASRA